MTIDRMMVPGQATPFSHYCHMVRADKQVWVSGAVGSDADGNIPDSTVEQFRIALASVDACLRAAGAGPEHVVKVNLYLTDISERGTINPERVRYFGEHRPASTLVGVAALVDPRMKVEIEAVAVLP